MIQRGMLQADSTYTFESLLEAGPWDFVFWLFCAGVHALVFSVVMSPVDLYASSMASLLTVYFLGRLCAPRCSQLNMTQENMNLLDYSAGLAVAGYNIPDAHAGRGVALIAAILVSLDYMLGVGHTWDSLPHTQYGGRDQLPALLGVLRVPMPGGALCGVARPPLGGVKLYSKMDTVTPCQWRSKDPAHRSVRWASTSHASSRQRSQRQRSQS